ncbi:class I SAM-dependent methyltransferase [Spongiibacter nanhainus]|uniref:Class I SAM-dependent methyltransferase n=1 Tax=Spongiibacter nanhainus TaxID=2794344 RepID=A0A7T4US33_9GAMM|nr:class I SAM-dependent methyltransferase [Spongiibacter nanhainus]QQD19913.1 class I SAM-dependent methyltransferase [Spongiibacter nanhainus]
MNSDYLDCPFGKLQLQRRPRRRNEVLQAWDAADRYLLKRVAELNLPSSARILLVNDSFGTLATALSEFQCTLWSDSAVSHLAAAENAALNQRPSPHCLPATDLPEGPFDLVLLRPPRSHSLLSYQLQAIGNLISSPTQFVAAAMAKYIDIALLKVFEQNIGPCQPSLAWKKSRLLELSALSDSRHQQDDSHFLDAAEYGLTLRNRANVFSRDKLDRGSRLMLQALTQLPHASCIADLGCGNGLLGIMAAKHWPDTEVHFFDESFLAVDSARDNAQRNLTHPANHHFHCDDCMGQYNGPSFDLVLCNPPFHQGQQIGDHIARQMFKDAKRHLRPGGKLCVVGNRHLGYHLTLKKLFGGAEVVLSDRKFVVLLSSKAR